MKTTPTRGDIIVSLVIIGGAFVAGALCAIAGVAAAYASFAGCAS